MQPPLKRLPFDSGATRLSVHGAADALSSAIWEHAAIVRWEWTASWYTLAAAHHRAPHARRGRPPQSGGGGRDLSWGERERGVIERK